MENNYYENREPQQVPQYEEPENRKTNGHGKHSQTVGILAAAALIALACGYAGSWAASQNAGKVVIQKVTGSSGTGSSDGEEMSATDVAAAISPTVVSIATEQIQYNQFWYGAQVSSGAGSGVIISEDGYILTCAHVVSGADSIAVTDYEGNEYQAQLVGSYETGDIAVIKIDAQGLQAATLGDSDQVKLAETVYAVGNPGGTLGGSITDGIISATERTITVALDSSSQSYGFGSVRNAVSLDVLQTSTAVSPGNSGGGLFNSSGELIGIVNAKGSGDSQEGIGFAIPINTAQEIATGLINDGYYTGDTLTESENDAVMNITVSEIGSEQAQLAGVEAGLYVRSVEEGGASDGLLEAGDRIISVEDTVIKTVKQLSNVLAKYEPGETVSVSVERNGKMITTDITLAQNQNQTESSEETE
ncbi:trypsin [Marvinbryantia formatexigens DSM 14469]|uniref:Trypsin n=1 Tax=Marvinbryantia formatexigens DSM 14469 TaxID=478749 RepID=C6LEC6_9FIRM|nr:trypsin-like peptidase domain-containing protein [Marvinbryantia formatexigens]EET60909.1 trypsin [Marvinbryantia formatexigens DSM 14469]UWO24792.1 S1C family serine protease [Marvinbryantia formatexigens DSM 14469]SDF23530.1 serine protease Do [Marvinbryantia formatexigens]